MTLPRPGDLRLGGPIYGSPGGAPALDPGTPVARLQLPGVAESVPTARAFLTSLLRSWKVATESVEDVELLVSEVAGNAVRHGRGDVAVEVSKSAETVHIEVHDSERAMPRFVDSETHPDAEGGRGMWLVDALAERWGTRGLDDGKAVWFEVSARRG
ncbi:ATP-binding protein [Motilibacter deserti]|uniref:ATP-binding protein n=1 Tax=Motilibacter deserti TaxID=2714956 RepID=A0ABX0GYV8_9ACTN|nr:ATP-binding protein [Motilibacter deserti]NHC14895.1 ATP-binding protein [Motilibacter deserti]